MLNANFIILIGGAPTVGKSTLTKKLSKHFDVPWISTDHLREILKGFLDKKTYPDLFNDEMSAEEFFEKYSKEEIVSMENQQSKIVWKAMKNFIENSYPWKSFIMEGVAVLPEFIHKLKTDKKIIPIFLVDEDADRIRSVVYTRGLFGPANTYSDSVKESEIAWCQEFSKQLKGECKKYNYGFIEVSKNEDDIEKVLNHIHSCEI